LQKLANSSQKLSFLSSAPGVVSIVKRSGGIPMHIEIQSRNVKLTRGLRKLLNRRVEFAFNRFKDRIQKVKIQLSDINGQKGGLDKECQFHLTLPDQPDVIVKGTSDKLESAISTTATRSAKTLARKLKRKPSFTALKYNTVDA